MKTASMASYFVKQQIASKPSGGRSRKADLTDFEQTKFIADEVKELLRQQVSHEFSNAYAYLAFATKADVLAYEGFSEFYQEQAMGEIDHAKKIMKFLMDTGTDVEVYDGTSSVSTKDYGIVDMLRIAMELEMSTTRHWKKIVLAVMAHQNLSVLNLCQDFLDEQIEEEDLTGKLLQRLERVKDDPAGIQFLDNELKED